MSSSKKRSSRKPHRCCCAGDTDACSDAWYSLRDRDPADPRLAYLSLVKGDRGADDKHRRMLWLKFVDTKESDLKAVRPKICGVHFKKQDFKTTNVRGYSTVLREQTATADTDPSLVFIDKKSGVKKYWTCPVVTKLDRDKDQTIHGPASPSCSQTKKVRLQDAASLPVQSISAPPIVAGATATTKTEAGAVRLDTTSKTVEEPQSEEGVAAGLKPLISAIEIAVGNKLPDENNQVEFQKLRAQVAALKTENATLRHEKRIAETIAESLKVVVSELERQLQILQKEVGQQTTKDFASDNVSVAQLGLCALVKSKPRS